VLIVQPIGLLILWLVQLTRERRKKRMEEQADPAKQASLQDAEPQAATAKVRAAPTDVGAAPTETGAVMSEAGADMAEDKISQADQPQAAHESPSGKNIADKSWWKRRPSTQKGWTTVTNGVLALAILCIIVGFITGHDFQAIARVCSIIYGVLLVVSLFTAYMEGKKALAESAE
jgi:hypothetical protein